MEKIGFRGFTFSFAVGLILLLSLGIVSAQDLTLNQYPRFFVKHNVFTASFIVGDTAAASDVLGLVDIVSSLQFKLDEKIQTGAGKLASEVDDVREIDAIVVGGPCANAAAALLMDFPEPCMEGFVRGKGFIRIYENSGKVQLLVAGATALDTRRTSRVLANSEDYNLEGDFVEISGTSLSDVLIQ